MKCLFWLILFPALLSAQTKIDSLKKVLASGNPDHAAYYLSNIGYEFLITRQYDSALKYYYKISLTHSDSALMAATLTGIGVAYKEKAFYDSSIHYHLQVLPIYMLMHDTTNAITIASNLAVIYKNKAFYEKALEYAFDANNALEKRPPDRALASSYNTIAEIYRTMNDYKEAHFYYRKGLSVRRQIGYKRGEGQSYHNLGELFFLTKEYDSAITNLNHALEIKQMMKDESAIANTLAVLGNVYIDLHQLNTAENYLMKAWEIKRLSGERAEQAMLLNSLGSLKLEQKEWTDAASYLKQAEILIRQIGKLSLLKDNLDLQIRLSKARGQYAMAIQYAEELIGIKDSILNKDKTQSIIDLQTRYETEKKEQQIQLLEQNKLLQQAEIESKQSWITTLIITIALATIIALLLWIGFRASQRNHQKVELLLKELNHRVKNNLQILSSILSLQSLHLKDEDAIQAIKSSESRVNTMALIHKKLYREDNTSSINMQAYITELSAFLMHSYGFTAESLQLRISGAEINVDVDKAIPIGLIMNELISNAFKYAYTQQSHPQMSIQFQQSGTQLKLEISDNGKGIKQDDTSTNKGSFGLKMVHTLVKELKGEMKVTATEGTAYTIQLPLHG